MTKAQATEKARLLQINYTIGELAKKLGITRPTLYVRLAEGNWKLGEIALLEKL